MSREEKELRFASTTTLYAACCSPTSVGTYCSCIQDDIGDDKIVLNISLIHFFIKNECSDKYYYWEFRKPNNTIKLCYSFL